MSSYRYSEDLRERYGDSANRSASMIRRATVDGHGPDDTAAANVAQDETGEVTTIEAEQFGVAGFAGRSADDVTTEAIVTAIGGSPDHAVVVGVLDHGRFRVLDVEPLESDSAVMYNQSARVLVVGSEIRATSIGASGDSVAFKSDADSLNARIALVEVALNALIALFNVHVALPAHIPMPPLGVPSATSATVQGTSVLRAE